MVVEQPGMFYCLINVMQFNHIPPCRCLLNKFYINQININHLNDIVLTICLWWIFCLYRIYNFCCVYWIVEAVLDSACLCCYLLLLLLLSDYFIFKELILLSLDSWMLLKLSSYNFFKFDIYISSLCFMSKVDFQYKFLWFSYFAWVWFFYV